VGRVFPGGGEPLGDFSKIFLWGPKVVKFVFAHSKLRKQPFFAEIFKTQGAQAPLPTPMEVSRMLLTLKTINALEEQHTQCYLDRVHVKAIQVGLCRKRMVATS